MGQVLVLELMSPVLLETNHMCVLIVGKIASSANKEFTILVTLGPDNWPRLIARSHGVMVSTLDSESSDPSSNLGETSNFFIALREMCPI